MAKKKYIVKWNNLSMLAPTVMSFEGMSEIVMTTAA
jgi:hypothetical protein